MDWFRGKFTGKPYIWWEINGFLSILPWTNPLNMGLIHPNLLEQIQVPIHIASEGESWLEIILILIWALQWWSGSIPVLLADSVPHRDSVWHHKMPVFCGQIICGVFHGAMLGNRIVYPFTSSIQFSPICFYMFLHPFWLPCNRHLHSWSFGHLHDKQLQPERKKKHSLRCQTQQVFLLVHLTS